MMQAKFASSSVRNLASLPTAEGGLSRLAADRALRAGIKLDALLSRAGMTRDQINDPEQRIDARNQIAFLEFAAEALDEQFLGFSLAEVFDCRDLGMMYYVAASSDTLGNALTRASRYSRITNESIVLEYEDARVPTLRLKYAGVPRHADRQQIEFCIIAMLRMSRLLSGRQFLPARVSLMHARTRGISKFARFLGSNVEFGADADEIGFPAGSADWTLTHADSRLNKLLLKVCEDALKARRKNTAPFRTIVENAIAPLLPHGNAQANVVAKKLGMGERTLARRLAEEGVTFIEVLQQLKAILASRYLGDDDIPISKIAWLLGFDEPSSFTHACRRWTGKSPRELRRQL